MGIKPGDQWCVPLCHMHHMQLHDYGNEQLWWAMHGVDPEEWARKSWRLWNDSITSTQEGDDENS